MQHRPTISTCTTTLKLLADFWNLRIIEGLATGPQRFCELQRLLNGVNPATLTKKLSVLETAKLITRTTEDGEHHVVYTLTPTGTRSLPVLAAIEKFSAGYEGAPTHPA